MGRRKCKGAGVSFWRRLGDGFGGGIVFLFDRLQELG